MQRLAFRIASQPRAIRSQGKNAELAAYWEGLRPGILSPAFRSTTFNFSNFEAAPKRVYSSIHGDKNACSIHAAVVLGLTLGTSVVFGCACAASCLWS